MNRKRYKNLKTGEVIEATEITKKVDQGDFPIIHLSAILDLAEALGDKKIQVAKYILENMEKANNTLIITTRELAAKSNVGMKTVLETLKILEESEIIKRRTGSIKINSDFMGVEEETALIIRFYEDEI